MGTRRFGSSYEGKGKQRHTYHVGRMDLKRKLLVILAVALVPLSGTAACGGVEQEIRQRANEEVEKGKQRVEQEVDKGRTQLEQEVTQRVGEGASEAERRAREGVQQGREQLGQ